MRQTRVFPSTAGSSLEARRFVISLIASLAAEVRDSVELMVSELATNAQLHAATDFEVGVAYSDSEERLRVAVTDHGPGNPTLKRPTVADPHGRGLQIVSMLSHSWGIDSTPHQQGKTVWFELNAAPAQVGTTLSRSAESRRSAYR